MGNGPEVVPDEPGWLALPGRPVGCLGWPGWRSSWPGAVASSNCAAPPLLSPQVGYLVGLYTRVYAYIRVYRPS